jgi:hypothetical protein
MTRGSSKELREAELSIARTDPLSRAFAAFLAHAEREGWTTSAAAAQAAAGTPSKRGRGGGKKAAPPPAAAAAAAEARFEFDDECLKGDETAEALDMSDGDLVDVVLP